MTQEMEVRLILKRHFPDIMLECLLNEGKSALLEHLDKTKGVVPTSLIYQLGVTECETSASTGGQKAASS